MAWSTQFSDFNNYVDSGNARNYRNNRTNLPQKTNNDNGFMKIEDIQLGSNSIVNILGLVISKEEPRSVQSHKNAGAERYVLNLTVRDSPLYFVNVSIWGKEQYIKELNEKYHIGDTVSLSNVQILSKPQDGTEEKYRAATPVPFNISASENHSTIEWYNGPLCDEMSGLQHIPVKATNDFYTLEDITANGQGLHGEHVNILCVVRKIGQVKDIKTKTGRQMKRCELRVLDETCTSFGFILWNKELIDLALTWTPLETVLFVADVKTTYDDFRSTMIATADSQTIITVNPDTLEAQSLYQFAHSQNFLDTEENTTTKSDPSLDTITDIYSVGKIKKLMSDLSTQWKQTQYGITYVFLTQFNLDSDHGGVLRYRCEKCRETVQEERGFLCSNVECTEGALAMFDSSAIHKLPLTEYSVPVAISDHQGTLEHCYLDGVVMESLLGIKAEDFRALGLDQKTQLKWSFLLERCKIYFKVYRSSHENKSVFKILSLEKARAQDIPLTLLNEQ